MSDRRPVSAAQREMWVAQQLNPTSPAYTIGVCVELRGRVDPALMSRAVALALDECEALRVRFAEDAGGLWQVVDDDSAALLRLPRVEDADEAYAWMRADLAVPADLSRESGSGHALFLLGDQLSLLYLRCHHVALDGFGQALYLRRLAEIYTALAGGGEPGPTPFGRLADLVAEDAAYRTSDRHARDRAYWLRAGEGPAASVLLSGRRPLPSDAGVRIARAMPDALAAALGHRADELAVPWSALTVAAVAGYLHRLTGADDVVVRMPFTGRSSRLALRTPGMLANELPVRLRVEPGTTGAELARQAALRLSEALRHQRFRGEDLARETGGPAAAVLVNIIGYDLDPRFAGVPGVLRQLSVPTVDELAVNITGAPGSPGGVRVLFDGNPRVFDPAEVDAYARRFLTFLGRLLDDPRASVGRLDVLLPGEDAELDSFLAGAAPVEAEPDLVHLFRRQVARAPERVAVVDGRREYSYRELDEWSDAIAARLGDRVRREMPVALLMRRGAVLVAATLGILKAGGAYLPLHEDSPAPRLRTVLGEAGARLVLTDRETAGRAGELGVETLTLDPAPLYAPDGFRPVPVADGTQLAYVMYTSGSTGVPKGVAVSHADVAALAADRRFRRGHERVLLHSPHAFDASTYELWVPLLGGGRVIVAPPQELGPEEIAALIGRYALTALWLTAGLFRVLVEQRPECLRGLGAIWTGGDVVSPAAVARVLAACPGVTVVNGYGPTETTTFALSNPVTAIADSVESVPIGRPLDGMRARVLDAKLRPVPVGVQGELYLAGAGLARGYLGRPALTGERFVAEPGGTGSRMYRTGDLARWRPGGVLEFVGRVDGQVKVRGFRVEVGEIEAVVGTFDPVTHCVVTVRDDARLVAYVVAAAEVDVAELRSHVAERLPAFMVPSAFVVLPQLPLTANGKVDLSRLPQPPVAVGSRSQGGTDPVEEILCGLFEEVLGVAGVSSGDGLVELGGHSLHALRLAGHIRDTLNAGLSLRDVFEAPTVADLARVVRRRRDHGRGLPALVGGLAGDEPTPLSAGQRRLWFVQEFGGGAAYHVAMALRLDGPVDAAALELAVADVVDRHEVLRSVVVDDGDDVRQVVTRSRPALPVVEVSGEQVGQRLTQLAGHPFDLRAEAPFRAWLLRASSPSPSQVLLLVAHHLVVDAGSLRPLASDLGTAYAARVLGEKPAWSALPVSFADFVVWQRGWLGAEDDAGGVAARQIGYWRERLAGLPEEITVPPVHARSGRSDPPAGRLRRDVPNEVSRGVAALARERGVTVFMMLQAALVTLLSRMGAGTDVAVGAPVSGRIDPALRPVVGYFLNMLVLRTDASGDPSFADLLERVREGDLDAYDNADVPFERLVDLLRPARVVDRHPLFQVTMTVTDERDEGLGVFTDLGGLPVTAEGVPTGIAKFDLAFSFCRCDDDLAVDLEYRRDLYDSDDAAALVERLIGLLAAAVAEPAAPISELPVLSATETAWLERVGTGPAGPPAADVWALVDRAARRVDDQVAVLGGGGSLTYAELVDRARGLAGALRRAGAGSEARVAVLAPRTPELLIALLAVLRAGAVVVLLDGTLPLQRRRAMVTDAGVVAVVSVGEWAEQAAELGVPVIFTDASAECPMPAGPVAPQQGAYVVFTSGSTGRPKGVVVSRGNLANFLADMRARVPLAAGERLVAVTTVGFDIAVLELLLPICGGATVVLADRAVLGELGGLARLVRDSGARVLQATPSLLAGVLADDPSALAGLRILVGGEALPPELASALTDGAASVRNMYGPTETTIWSSVAELGPAATGTPPIGKPIRNTRVYVLDRRLRPVPVGVPGEIYLAGDGVARGYQGQPGLTAERFVADLGRAGERMYRTGDIGRWRRDGQLDYLGRGDHQVKLRGHRIEAGEIESVLAGHPAVGRAVVLLLNDPHPRLVGYLTPAGPTPPDPDEVRVHARSLLPEYMIPAALVVLEALPLNANGKLDRAALPRPADGDPAGRAPRTEVERLICELFAGILDRRAVTIDDGFFELGGDSVLSLRLVSRARRHGLPITVHDVFQHPTPAALARAVEDAGPAASDDPAGALPTQLPADELDALLRDEPGVAEVLPLSPLQEGLLFHSTFDERSGGPYLTQVWLDLVGDIDSVALHEACAALLARHPGLRAEFRHLGLSRPVQLIRSTVAPAFREYDEDPAACVTRERAAGFDLARAPLLRFSLVRVGPGRSRFVVTAHHILLDGWSLPLLLREVLSAYAKQPVPPSRPYRDYLAWLARHDPAAGPEIWRRLLADVDGPTRLASAAADPGAEVTRLPFTIAPGLHDALVARARAAGLTVNTFVQAAFAVVLGALTGRSDITFGVTVSGRPAELAGVESMIGLFINTLPVPLRLRPQEPVGELLERVRDLSVAVLPHHHVALAELRRAAGGELFDAILVFENYPLDLDVLNTTAAEAGLSVEAADGYDGTHYPLSLIALPGRVLRFRLDHRLPAEAAGIVVAAMRRALAAFAGDPAVPLGRVDLLGDGVRRLAEWNATEHVVPSTTLVALLEAQAARTPEAPAVVFEGETLSYAALHDRADRLAGVLAARGAAPGRFVAVAVPRSHDLLVALLAVLKTGAAYLPIDPDYPAGRIRHMLSDAAPALLLTTAAAEAALPAEVPVARLRVDAADVREFARPAVVIPPGSPAYMIYTSGSTGRPKGVVVSHAAIVNRLLWMQNEYRLDADDRVLQKTPSGFDVSVWEFFWPLLTGAALVVARPEGHRDAAYLAGLIRDESVTTVHFVPSMLRAFLADDAARGCVSLRRVICSGESLPADLVARFPGVLGASLHNLYGPTEAAVDVSFWECVPGAADDPVPIGRPIWNTGLHVLDAGLRPCPPGTPGELYLSGAGLALGYHDRAALTASRFVAGPAGSRLYRTGDLARWRPDGVLEYLGRTDHQLKIRGQRVELGEIESVLATHPTVAAAVVLTHADPRGTNRLVAYVTAAGDASVDVDALRAHAAVTLPEHMLPATVVVLHALPLTVNGKLDRAALPAPEWTGRSLARRPPANRREEVLSGLFAEVLDVPDVGVDEGFFALGGDSILSMHLVGRARRHGLRLSPRDIFERPTVAALAACPGIEAPPPGPPDDDGTGPAHETPIAAWYAARGGPGQRLAQSMVVPVPAELTRDTLVAAVGAVLTRHDALRLRVSDGHEVLAPTAVDAVTRVSLVDDMDALPAAAVAARGRLDPAAGRMIEFVWCPSARRLAVVVHHLSVDAVSWRILLADLEGAWRLARTGEPPRLARHGTSWRRWTELVRERAGSPAVLDTLVRWAETLARPTARLASRPLDPARDVQATARRITVDVSVALTEALLDEVAPAFSARVDELLVAALAIAMRSLDNGGTGGILLDLEGHGRQGLPDCEEVDVSGTVGWFTALYPVHVDAGPGTVGQAVKRVRQQLAEIPHHGVSFGLLRYANPEAGARLAALGVPEIGVNYLGRMTAGAGRDWAPIPELADVAGGADDGLALAHPIDLDAALLDERTGARLTSRWTWAGDAVPDGVVHRLADAWVEALRVLVRHVRAEGGGRVPADLPLVALSQPEVDLLTATHPDLVDVWPLTPLQEGLLYHRLLAEDGAEDARDVYVTQVVLRVSGGLDIERLRRAATALMAAHPSLNLAFHHDGLAQPVSVVLPAGPAPVRVVDLSDVPAAQRDRRAGELVAEERELPFPLDRPPLLRFAVLSVGDEHQIALTAHHLLLDGWSTALLLRELLHRYADPGNPPAAPRPYREFVAWLAARPPDVPGVWQAALRGLDGATLVAPAAPASDGTPPRQLRFTLDEERTAALRDAARRHNLTLTTILQGAWALVLSRLTGRYDVVFGGTVSGRPADLAGFEEMVGLFANTAPVRVTIREHEPPVEMLGRLQREQAALSEHPQVNLADLIRLAGQGELFDTAMVVENYPLPEEERVGGLRLVGVDGHDATHYPLALAATPGTTLSLRLDYRPDLFDDEAADAIRRRFVEALTLAWREPELLFPQERELLLHRWPGKRGELGRHTVVELFRAQVARTPDAVALVHGDDSRSYAELERDVDRVAGWLGDRGVGPGQYIAIALPRGIEPVVCQIAVLSLGAAYVPLDPDHPAPRLRHVLGEVAPSVLITDRAHLRLGELCTGEVVTLDEVGAARPRTLRNTTLRAADAAYVIHTSGSTGRPKGVVVTHRGLPNLAAEQIRAFGVDARSRVLQFASTTFDAAVSELWMALLSGAGLVLAPADDLVPGAPLEATLRRHGISHVTLPPAALAELDPAAVPPGMTVVVAGEVCPAELVEAWAPGRRMINAYGPTEATVCVSLSAPLEGGLPPIGRPIANVLAYVLDGRLRPVLPGVPGELYVAGVGLARGYLGRPDLTAERFVASPHLGGERLYRTGDLVRWTSDGVLEYLGRSDEQIKIRGFRVEPGEIETVLLSHPAVERAVVIAREHAGGPRLIAYLACPGGMPSTAELRSLVAESLPAYMVPAAFVAVAGFPVTPNGKLDRAALPEPDYALGASARAPRTPQEQALCGLFAEVLGVARVGLDDSFFDLGGHSLLATRLISRLRSTFGVELTVRQLFDTPTVAALAPALATAGPAGAPLTTRARPERLPLSYAQRRLWFLHRLDDAGSAYTMPLALRLRGKLDPDRLRVALGAVVARHESLRTVFREDADGPYQVILPAGEVELEVVAGTDDDVRRHAAAPFDLAEEPPLRATLFVMAEGDHVLLLVLHHIAGDGWSIRPLLHDLTAAYEGRPLGELPVQYADYALWQAHERGRVVEEQAAHWCTVLAGLPEELPLPFDRPRPARPSHRGGHVPLTIPAELHERLLALARTRHATAFMVLHAALAALLTRLGAGTDVPIGSPAAGRTHDELDALVGFFVNTLVLRTDTGGGTTFGELLDRVRATDLDAYAHQEVPFERLVELLNPARSAARHPLCQVVLTVDDEGESALRQAFVTVPELAAEPYPVELDTAKFDLVLTVATRRGADGVPAGMQGVLEYSEDLFDAGTAAGIAERFVRLLDAVVTDPDRRIDDVDLLAATECARLVRAPALSPDTGDTITAVFARQVRDAPDRPAVTGYGVTLTYGELDARADRLARVLLAHGAGPERFVAVALPRAVDLVVALLGVLKSGSAYLPVDPTYPAGRIAAMLADAGPVAVVTAPSVTGLPETGIPCVGLDDEEGGAEHPAPIRSGHAAYMIYTSGSTGTPKGVVVTHRQVLRLFEATRDRFGFGPDDVWTLFHSYAFDFSVWELWGALLHGGRLVVVPHEVSRSPEEFLRLLAAERVTVLNQTPSAFYQLAEADAREPDVSIGLALRTVVFGGEALDPGRLAGWRDRHPVTPDLVNMYGITETTVHVTYSLLDRSAGDAAGPIGLALPDLAVYLLDERLRPVPPGVVGEMYVGGAGVARGYHGQSGLTASRFVADPFAGPGTRMYRSGDLARYGDDGALRYVGRGDAQVKLRGFRIEPGEIETVLRACDGVVDAVVLLREDHPGDSRLVGYVVSRAADLDTEVIRARVAERLPEHMVPSAVVRVDAFPLTANGKLSRAALPAPDPRESSGRAPRTVTEEILAGLFAEILGVPRVGADVSFFDLGGHSLLATRLVTRVRATLGRELSIGQVFRSPTVAGLARALGAAAAVTGGLVPMPRPERVPLSYAARRLWFLQQFDPSSSAYHVPVALRLTGVLDRAALAAAVADLARRHEPLRTRYGQDGPEPYQVVSGELPELVTVPTGTPLAELVSRPFDLTRDIPLRAWLVPSGPDEHVLLLVAHHIAADERSLPPLIGDLAEAYAARRAGREPDWAPLPVQYADYALWQRVVLGTETDPESPLARQLAYWRERLAGLPDELSLPVDRPRPPVASDRGGTIRFTVPGALHERLAELARRSGATMFMVVQAALAVVLSRLGGGPDVPIGAPIAGRVDEALTGLVGFFVNTLVLRTDVAGDPSFAELLGRVRRHDLDAYAHADVPFELLVEALGVSRSAARHPLFQVVLVVEPVDTELAERAAGGFEGLRAEPVEVGSATAKFDLTVALTGRPGSGYDGLIQYRADLFDPGTVAGLADRLIRVLASAADRPDQPVTDLPMLTAAERDRVLRDWSGAGIPAPAPATIVERFIAQRDRVPDAVAVRSDVAVLTYRQLAERAGELAGRLVAAGASPGSRVLMAMDRSADLVAATLAVLWAGAAYVPLHESLPAARIREVAATIGAGIVLCDRANAELAGALGLTVVVVDQAAAHTVPPPTRRLPDDLAYVMYTSGSTGVPKGVAITHRDVVELAGDHRWRRPAHRRVLLHSPYAFDAATYELWVPLLSGGEVVVAPPGRLDVPTLQRVVTGYGVTGLWLTAGLFRLIAEEAPTCLASVAEVWTGGDVVPAQAVLWFREHCPALRIVDGYGPTETTTFATCFELPPEAAVPARVPIGRPLDGNRVYVLDRRLRPVPPGVAGELYIGGSGVARGYLGAASATAERFVADPYGPAGERLYRTGDLARWRSDGLLEFLGRADDQVKLRGFRIEPGEVEAALAADPAVAQAAVLVREDRPGDRRLVGYVTTDPSEVDRVRERLCDRLPDYLMPAALVALPALPLTANGKLDRSALPAPPAEPRRAGGAPRDAREALLSRLVAEVLGRDEVGVDDDFFDLGGDSIRSIQLVSRARQAGLAFGARDVFERRSVARLARAATESLPAGEAPDSGTGEIAPTPIVRWFAERGGPVDGFAQSMVVRAPAGLTLDDLTAAVRALVDHHDALRMRLDDGGRLTVRPRAAVDAAAWVSRVALDGSDRDADRRMRRDADAVRRSLAPAEGAMVRVVWFDRGDRPGWVLLALHHLVVDGVSWRILLPDLAQAWADVRLGRLPALAPVPTSLRTWASRVAALADGGSLRRELPFWRETLGDGGEPIGPRRLDPARDRYATAGRFTVELDGATTEAVLTTVPAAFHATANEVLLTAYAAAVAEWRRRRGGQPGGPVRVEVEGHGRHEDSVGGVDLSRTVGWFTSIHPLRLDPGIADMAEVAAGGTAAGTVLKLVKEQVRAVPGDGFGYGVLRYLDPVAADELAAVPRPELAFNYLGWFAAGEDAEWSIDPELATIASGAEPQTPLSHVISLDALTRDGTAGPRLLASWTYARELVDATDVGELAGLWHDALRGLAIHVARPEAGGLTPSDVVLDVSQREIDEFQALEFEWEAQQ